MSNDFNPSVTLETFISQIIGLTLGSSLCLFKESFILSLQQKERILSGFHVFCLLLDKGRNISSSMRVFEN